ncbi:cupin domain-containing protein [Conexibacter woesei]|uniref:Cupin 2 conserved barrel domain protein n=1 Tax=Conexibacter woesei (strain DSM 14684 / CCUG 47730 / CIP 108061 / JCM 11494 / NBRC 100937 / ID131577) TaxID=469383 RepID=D3FCC1_CONWI|nr:cupin domain-containing protein [Conexibacter woesei]ADB53416.1 Cupin 2 conserved barrel domain protein [Conexibacter woesei DSM 14684]
MSAATLIPAAGPLADATAGGHLELVSQFEVLPGGHVNPHSHPTHEFYLVRSGRGLMTVGERAWEIVPGDLVTIPSEVVHSLEPVGDEPIRCFCFAVGDAGAGPVDYGTDGTEDASGLASADRSALADSPDSPVESAPATLPPLQVRNPRDHEPAMEHLGTVAVWWTVPPRELRDATLGGRLTAVTRHDWTAGGKRDIPASPALRVYCVLDGVGEVVAGDRRRALGDDDVVLLAPGVAHRFDGPLSLIAIDYEVTA